VKLSFRSPKQFGGVHVLSLWGHALFCRFCTLFCLAAIVTRPCYKLRQVGFSLRSARFSLRCWTTWHWSRLCPWF